MFTVQLITTDGKICRQYHGNDALEALSCYTMCFREYLTTPGKECIVSRINGKNTHHFKELVEDFYVNNK